MSKDVQPVNLTELNTTITNLAKQVEELKQAKIDPVETTSATEEIGVSTDPFQDYKPNLVEMLQATTQDSEFVWRGGDKIEEDRKIYEAIGKMTGTAATPEIWAADVFRCCPYPASAFWDNPYIKWHEDIHGKPGDTVNVIVVGKSSCGTAGCAEPVSTAPVVTHKAITLENYQCSMYICRTELEDMVSDTITELNESLASCMDACIDNAFIANMMGRGSTLDKGTAYITPDHIAELVGSMRSGTCEPVMAVMHPAVEARLMMDSQFTNAATYGARSVITGGHIVGYLGIEFHVIPKGSLAVDAPGTYATLFTSRYAIHAAKKRDPTLETQYLVKDRIRYVYLGVRFGKKAVCEDGIYWLRTGA